MGKWEKPGLSGKKCRKTAFFSSRAVFCLDWSSKNFHSDTSSNLLTEQPNLYSHVITIVRAIYFVIIYTLFSIALVTKVLSIPWLTALAWQLFACSSDFEESFLNNRKAPGSVDKNQVLYRGPPSLGTVRPEDTGSKWAFSDVAWTFTPCKTHWNAIEMPGRRHVRVLILLASHSLGDPLLSSVASYGHDKG